MLKKYKAIILENIKNAKLLVNKGSLSKEDLEALIEIDPHPKKAFVGWLAKVWVLEKPDFDELKSLVEEYYTFLQNGTARTRDIYLFKTFNDLSNEVEELNKYGAGISSRQLEKMYNVVRDDNVLKIYNPYSHPASRYLGLSIFNYRHCKGPDGKQLYNPDGTPKLDSAWCTTYENPGHFEGYHYDQNNEIYYIKVMDKELRKAVSKEFGPQFVVFAILIEPNGELKGWDGKDTYHKEPAVLKYLKFIGVDV